MIDIILIQKLYINNNYIIMLYSVFNNIISNCIIKLRVILFIKKNINHIIIILKSNIYQDLNI